MPTLDVDELFLTWRELQRAGREVSPEKLCPGRPDVAEQLKQRIQLAEETESKSAATDPQEATIADPEPLIASAATSNQDPDPDSATIVHVDEASTEPAHPAPTLHIPGYEIERVIDRGGMGVVYLAKQSALGRTVALKMIAGPPGSTRHIARFRSEAEAVAHLVHPNIVQIYEIGEVHHHPFFSMEYVEGGSLADMLADGLPHPRRAAELVETIARAVHYAHERHIVHRDVKPANVLLTIDGTPKITDFGLAKRLNDDSGHTQTGEIVGTPRYMAPEQADGNIAAIGPLTDVYAMGVLLYELLTGEAPLVGKTPIETIRMVASAEPESPRKRQPSTPRDLEAVCLKCLEKSPDYRYESAEDLADDLRRYLNGEPVRARHTSLVGKTLKWSRRRPEMAALATIAVAAIVGLASFTLWSHYEGIASVARAEGERKELAVELAPQAREILTRNCFECHGENPERIERNLHILEHGDLLDGDRGIIVAGKPDESRMIQRIVDASMPPEAEEERLPRVSQRELDILKKWIAGGAPEFPPEDPENPTPPVVAYSPLAAEVKAIFHQHCYECHDYVQAKGGIKILQYDLLVSKRKVVVPGDAENSELFQLITTTGKGVMPPEGYDRLNEDDVTAIKQWIADGAPPFPKSR